MRNKKILILFSIFYFLFSIAPALAFESTSTTFEMHGAALESISGSSSSPSFGQQSAGGQNATGIISNVKQIFSGVLYWLFGWYAPRYDQIHFRWRNDDGSESGGSGQTLYFNPTGNGFGTVDFTINAGCSAGSEWDCVDDDTADTSSTAPTNDGATTELKSANATDYYTLADNVLPGDATTTQLNISVWAADIGNPNTSITLGYCIVCDGATNVMGSPQTVNNASYVEYAQQFTSLSLSATDMNNMQIVVQADGIRAGITTTYVKATYSTSGATWAQTQDVSYSGMPRSTTTRLRFEISNEGWTRGAAPTFQLQYATTTDCPNGNYVAVPTDTSKAWQIIDSTYLTDGAATTNVSGGLTDENTTFTAGQVKDAGNTTGAITLNSDNFTEIEYSIQATTNAVSGQTYCFRVSGNNLVYTRYAAATISGYSATGSVISATYDTGLANGAAYNSIVWQGALNGGKVKFQIGTSNTDSGWTYYGPDCTTGSWYDIAPDTSTEIGCPSTHNNKRYFRYKIMLCSESTCSASGSNTPRVDDVIVNWSP